MTNQSALPRHLRRLQGNKGVREGMTIYTAWDDIGVLLARWSNHKNSGLNPLEASRADKRRLDDEVAVRLADRRLPVPPVGHEYIVQMDGLYVRALQGGIPA